MISEANWALIDSVHGWMSRPECEWIAETAARMDSWTEVGVNCGRSALCAGLHLRPEGWLCLVDSRFPWPFVETWRLLRGHRPDLRIVIAECDSLVAAKHLPYTEAVFVDGDHSRAAVEADIAAWRPKCRLLCGHDYGPSDQWPGVIEAVDAALGAVDNPIHSIWVARG